MCDIKSIWCFFYYVCDPYFPESFCRCHFPHECKHYWNVTFRREIKWERMIKIDRERERVRERAHNARSGGYQKQEKVCSATNKTLCSGFENSLYNFIELNKNYHMRWKALTICVNSMFSCENSCFEGKFSTERNSLRNSFFFSLSFNNAQIQSLMSVRACGCILGMRWEFLGLSSCDVTIHNKEREYMHRKQL